MASSGGMGDEGCIEVKVLDGEVKRGGEMF